ncbi:T9SS type A sorting domain-containing protein [Salibacter halophilus]|uniref:T9SS type A sorting domain-containing protein n=2 Tax=Salibacter halophilus TaxID=1803916 RepID=A0A6N6M4X8_9FLAO|nr:T9SS type A sorting domain-containing protein [Salibacter halophilus]
MIAKTIFSCFLSILLTLSLTAQLDSMILLSNNMQPGQIYPQKNGEVIVHQGTTIYFYDNDLNQKFTINASNNTLPVFNNFFIGSDDYIYAYSNGVNSGDNAGVARWDIQGNLSWVNDTLPKRSSNLNTDGSSGYSNLMQFGEEVFVFEMFGEGDSARYGVSHLDASTGKVESFEILDIPYSYFHYGFGLQNRAWYFSCAPGPNGTSEGMLEYRFDDTYDYNVVNNSAGMIFGSTQDELLSIQFQEETIDGESKYSTNFNKVNFDGTFILSEPIVSDWKNQYDTTSTYASNVVFSQTYGVIVAGTRKYHNGNWSDAEYFVAQINPDDGQTVWDTVFDQSSVGDFFLSVHSDNDRVYLMSNYTDFYELKFKELNFNTVLSDDKIEEEKTELKIYPNPTSSRFRIESSQEIESISVYDLSGRLVIDEMVRSRSYNSNLTNPGMYLVKIITDDGNTTVKRLIIR